MQQMRKKSDVTKDSFYEELEKAQVYVSKYHVKILLGDFNVNLGRKDIFNPTS